MAHLQERLQEDIQYFQKIEFVNKEDINTWVGLASVSNYILEDVCRSTLAKVTCVETQLEMHEVTM